MAEKYYAMIDGEQKGPFSLEELPGAGVRPSTYIWTKGLTDWQKAEDNADVCRLFRNHLYDLMHPSQEVQDESQQTDDNNKWKVQPDNAGGKPLSRFDRYLQETGQDPLPTVDEIEANKDTTMPPSSMVGYAWLATILCFPPLGIVALIYAYKSKKAWKTGENEKAHDFNRSAKMWTGITFFVGIILYGLFLGFG